jgi:SAM-dependent methyltransferase
VIHTDSRLSHFRTIWQEKPVLREIYAGYYQRITSHCRAGSILEIGSGSGNFLANRGFTVVATDILPAPWLDAVCDAQRLPFADQSFDNIVMVDVLHHLEHPARFFNEAQRVLKPGGRIVYVEPAITLLSWVFYNFLHPEPVDLSADPLKDGEITREKDPYDSNQAIPTLIARKARRRFALTFPQLKITATEWFDFLAYPLSGGFRPWSMLPAKWAGRLMSLERLFERPLGRLFAFRLLTVVEKYDAANN